MERQSFKTPDGTVAYWVGRTSDSAPWLVMLPGLTADHHLFDPQIETFEGSYNLLAWDAPFHGESRPFSGEFTLNGLAQLLEGILHHEGIEKPILVGQSLGGYIAQAFMQLYPGRAGGFVSVDSCPLKRRYYKGWEIFCLKHTYWMYMSIPWGLLAKLGADGCSETEKGRAYMRNLIASFAKKEYCLLAHMGYRALACAIEANLPYAIDCPALLICGTKDAAGSAKRYCAQWERIEGLPLEWIEGAGHNSNYDDPEAVNTLIQRFLGQLEGCA